MNNNVCKGCGRANLPNAKSCANCGLNLTQMPSNPFGDQEEDPLKTIAVGQQEINEIISDTSKSSTNDNSAESSNKLYWIIGGVGALVLVGSFLVIALSVGIYFFAFSGGSEEVATNNPKPTPQEDVSTGTDDSTPNSGSLDVEGKTAFGKALIKRIKSENSKVGNFDLRKLDNEDLVTFSKSFESVTAYYNDSSSSAEVIHTHSGYLRWQDAKREALKRAREFKKEDRKAIINNRGNYVNTAFKFSGRNYYLYCKKVENLGLCQLVSSKRFSKLREYMDAYYK